MIQIYQGKKRGLGDEPSKEAYAKVDFRFREILHYFKGAKLAVFASIMLHSNEDGVSFPGYTCIQKETGYGRDTIARALDELCTTTIDGKRILSRWRKRDSKGHFVGGNQYLIFPTSEELIPELENPTLEKPNSGKSSLEEEPTSKAKPAKESIPKPREPDPFFDVVVKVCQLNSKISGGYIKNTVKALTAMGKTADDVTAFGQWWYANDWRGQKGQAPTLNQLVTEIEKMKLVPQNGSNGVHPDKGTNDAPTPEMLEWARQVRAERNQNNANHS